MAVRDIIRHELRLSRVIDARTPLGASNSEPLSAIEFSRKRNCWVVYDSERLRAL